jgi:gliding motility-associated-like protein
LIPRKFLPKVILLAFVTLVFFPQKAIADHIVGGEFSYECLGFLNGDTLSGIKVYQIRINMYRDCVVEGNTGNAWFDGDPAGQGPNGENSAEGHISIYREQTLIAPTFDITLDSWRPVDINLGNPCLVISDEICQQIGIYEFIVELPVVDETYTLVYQRCCRNSSITNMTNSGQRGTTYFIDISPEAQQLCNASPRFNIDPPIAICVNEPFQIDLGATDANGDSLAYKFCFPLLGGGTDGNGQTATTFDDIVPLIESPPPYTPIVFRGPQFSISDQLGVGSTLSIDSISGLLAGEPIFRGTFVLGVCVEEWTRGPNPILLSETKREFQLNVSLCGNQVNADILETEFDDQGRFFIRQCGPGTNTIINESTDVNFITEYDWELMGPSGLITGSNRDFTSTINEVGVYEGTMIINRNSFAENCRDTAVFLLGVFPDSEANFEFTEVGCDDEPVVFTDRSTTAGTNQIVDWSWNFADGSTGSTRQNPAHQYVIPGDFPVQLTITDNNGCTASFTNQVPYFPSPRTIIIEPEDGFGCVPYTKEFINRSRPIDDTYTFEWEFGDGGTSDVASPTHVYEANGVYDVYLGITSPTGCFVDTVFQRLVDVREAPEADFFWTPDEVTNLFPDFRVFDRSRGATQLRYQIVNSRGEQVFTTPAPDFDYRLRDSSTYLISQLVTHPSGCVDTLTQEIRLKLRNSFFMPNAFTPNGDGLNDIFLPEGVLFGATNYQFRVWNRWGELVFTSNEPEIGWNGRYKGSDSPGGGYLWDVSFTDVGGEDQAFKGGVVLVR